MHITKCLLLDIFSKLCYKFLNMSKFWVSDMPVYYYIIQFSSVSCSVISDYCDTIGLQHARLPCRSPAPRACSNSCPLSRWCHPIISPSVIPLYTNLQSFPASGSFPVSQFFTSCGQSTGVSASESVPPMNMQDWLI